MIHANEGLSGHAPNVSVIIPAFRFSPHLDEAIDSVLSQSYTDFEVIVVNDGSSNRAGIERVLGRFGDRIRLITRQNGGPGAARNSGIAAAVGPLLAFLDEDDLWEPEFLDRQLALLAYRPDLDVVYTDALLFGDSPAAGRLLMDVCPTDGEPTLELLLARRCTVVMSAILGRRAAFEGIGCFEEDRRFSEDYDLWLRMVAAGSRIGYQRAPLTRRRIHADNFTRDNSRLVELVITTLIRFARTHVLSQREREALDDTLVAARSEIALVRVKASLAIGDIAAAKRESMAIDRSRLGWKAHVAMLALVLAPGLLALAYRARDRSAAEALKRAPLDRTADAFPTPTGGPR